MRSLVPTRQPLPDGDAAKTDGERLELQGPRGAAMARKYVWWQTPEQTLEDPCLLASQIMTLGTLDDVQWLRRHTSRDALRRVLRNPPVGVFNERSWRFWHLQLGMARCPPLPARPLPV